MERATLFEQRAGVRALIARHVERNLAFAERRLTESAKLGGARRRLCIMEAEDALRRARASADVGKSVSRRLAG